MRKEGLMHAWILKVLSLLTSTQPYRGRASRAAAPTFSACMRLVSPCSAGMSLHAGMIWPGNSRKAMLLM